MRTDPSPGSSRLLAQHVAEYLHLSAEPARGTNPDRRSRRPDVEFLRLPSPTAHPSPPDEGLTYTRSVSDIQPDPASPSPTWASVTLLDGEEPTDIILASQQHIMINDERFDRPLNLPIPGLM